MLGINDPSQRVPKPYRNYAAVEPGDSEFIELHRIGAVEPYKLSKDYQYYRCTEAGKLAAIQSHKSIRYTKKRRVYLKYLHIADALPDLTFREFLVEDEFRQARFEA
jgi:hypothetical protein